MQAVADFLREIIAKVEDPSPFIRTTYLQVEIDSTIMKMIHVSNELRLARTAREYEAAKTLNQALRRHAREIATMCGCIEAELTKGESHVQTETGQDQG
jgi:hypothetical protein